ncbi:MAG: hypothetical protein M5U07_19685 [Xanthobacteraceae bacterium]|nr:hypothetical protein [Xanthobacteraceae bacterium]
MLPDLLAVGVPWAVASIVLPLAVALAAIALGPHARHLVLPGALLGAVIALAAAA